MNEQVLRFWEALNHQQEWFEMPQKVYDDPIYMMRAKAGFIFDDAFWEVFQSFPLKVCHIAYYGLKRLEDGDRRQDTGIFELRFAPIKESAFLRQHWIVRFIDGLTLLGKRLSPREEENACGIGPKIYRKKVN